MNLVEIVHQCATKRTVFIGDIGWRHMQLIMRGSQMTAKLNQLFIVSGRIEFKQPLPDQPDVPHYRMPHHTDQLIELTAKGPVRKGGIAFLHNVDGRASGTPGKRIGVGSHQVSDVRPQKVLQDRSRIHAGQN